MSRVSVVLPTKDAGDGFEELLGSIRAQEVDEIEIIVVDSGSSDGTVAVAETMADTTIEIAPERFHHGRTRNLGAEHATGDIIVFSVQDALPTSTTWLPTLIEPIVSDTAAVTYGNQVAYPDSKPPDEFFYDYFYPDAKIVLDESDIRNKARFYLDNIFVSDACSAVSRRVWEEFRFRDAIGMSEDKDFAYRVARGGHTLQYCPNARIYHSHDYTFGTLFTRRYRDGMAYDEIAEPSPGHFLSDGIGYVQSEYSYLVRNGALRWIPYALVYDFIYLVSFSLGQHSDHLPDAVHRQLSG